MADHTHKDLSTRKSLLSLVNTAGYSISQPALSIGVPASTAHRWVQLSREGVEHRRPGSGRRCVCTPEQNAALVAEAVRNPFQSASAIITNSQFPGSTQTALQRLKDEKLFARIAAKKELLKDEHKLFRLAFSEENTNRNWNRFEKPGRRDDFDYPEMAKEAVTKALKDSRLQISDVKQACVGYVYGDSTCGQRALYEIGMTGMPVYNVNNNCSTGSTALFMAKQILESGNADCVLALGFEKMERGSLSSKVGYDMTKTAADRLFGKTQYSPQDVDVVELHDCFSANELITYEALGLCPPGKAAELIETGNNTYGGQYVINPSLAQCAELCWQLRGEAGRRQVPGAKLALQHNIGLGGAVVVALYRLGYPESLAARSSVGLNYTDTSVDPDDFKASILFKALEAAMQTDEDNLIERVRGVYGFKVKNGPNGKEGYWVINAKTGKGKIEFNGKAKPDVTFIMNDEDVVDLISGKLNPQKAFFQGKIKIQGNMGLAMKLTDLQKRAKNRIEEFRSKL
ncbi:Non-specific lipid-transfer protein [Blattella germanica]|nr:Non-specific lipid-transfer protein [Blattella germanica]